MHYGSDRRPHAATNRRATKGYKGQLRVKGLLKLAYKLLINDRAKFAALLVGITFAVFLMIEMTSLFSGVLDRSSSTVINIGAKVWVMDPAVTYRCEQHRHARLRFGRGTKHQWREIRGTALFGRGSRQVAKRSVPAGDRDRLGRYEPLWQARTARRADRGHLRRKRVYRRTGCGILQARESAPGNGIRGQ